jgi:hypothetical protein
MFDGIKLIRRKYISISEVISLSYSLKNIETTKEKFCRFCSSKKEL